MSIKPIDERLDQLVVGDEKIDPATMTPVAPVDVAAEREEPIQVAGILDRGLGKGLGKVLKNVQKSTPTIETSPVKRFEAAKDELKVEADAGVNKPTSGATEVDINAIVGEQPISVEGTRINVPPASPQTLFRVAESISKQPVAGRPPDIRVNLDVIKSEDELKQTYLAVVNEYQVWVDEQRRLGRTFDDIIADGQKIGDVSILKELARRSPGQDPFNDSKTFAANMAVLNLQSVTLSAIKKAADTGLSKDILEAGRLMALDGQLSASLLGMKAEQGRALAINRIIPSPDRERVRSLRKSIEQFGVEDIGKVDSEQEAAAMLEQLGGKDKMLAALSAYENLPNSNARAFYSSTMTRSVLDAASEIYQSALVSGVQTHLYNFLGSPIHFGMVTAERFAAAIAGKDEPLFQSTMASLRAFPRYWSQALSAAGEALKTEKTSDMATKFAQSRIATKAENFNVDPNTPLGKSIDYFGQAMRLMGFRVLTAADEGYKALFRGMEMEFMATDAGSKAFIKAVESGADEATASKIASDVYRATMKSDAAFEEASEFARVITFQDKLNGEFLGRMQEIMAHPVAKLGGFPFFNTVTQIGLRGMERTPFAAAMPRFWKAMSSPDPVERNIALAKVGVSSAIASTFMTVDFWTEGNIRITGHGPSDPKQRREWLAKNEPYSIGVRQKDGNYKWIGFKRYEPSGHALGVFADVRDTVSHIDDPEASEQILMKLALANMQYMTESQPSLQFFAELANTIGNSYEGEDDKAERILQLLQKQATEVGLVIGQSVVTGGLAPTGMTSTIEKIMENPIKSKIPENQYAYAEIPGYRMSLRAVYEAIAEQRAKSSFFTGSGVPETNEWFEPITREFDGWASVANALPLQVKTKKYNAVNEEMIKLKSGFPRLSPSMGEPGIKLNDIQMRRYKELSNYPDRSVAAEQYFGGQKPEPLLEVLIKHINSPEYQIAYDDYGNQIQAQPGDKIVALQNIVSAYRSRARDLMLLEFPELKAMIDQRNDFKKKTGKLPSKLPLSGETQSKLLPTQ